MTTHLKALQLKARHQVYTLLSGHNLSKLYGEGYDFAGLREYQMGDDIRKINWIITAKLSKPHIKELHANRELSVVVAAFMDASLYFGLKNSTNENDKQKKLTEVATVLALAAQHSGDLFMGLSYTQSQTYITVPTKQVYHIEQFSKILYETPLLHTSLNTSLATDDLFRRIHKPSLLFVLGDFLKEVDLSLLAQKHELIAIVIRNKEEESPRKLGEISFSNPHNDTKLDTYFSHNSIKSYIARLKENDDKLMAHFRRYNIRFVKIYTEDEVVGKLIKLFT